MILLRILKKIYWFFVYLQDGRKTYAFYYAVAGALAYLHWKRPELFGFTKKELLYLGLLLIYAMLNRNVLSKVHGHKISRYL